MDQTIAGWSPADLRRFVVNTILSDPGAFPKKAPEAPVDPTTLLPGQPHTDGDVPVWDNASQQWVSSTTHPVPSSSLTGVVRNPEDVAYIRIQGVPSGFIADGNFRIYSLSSSSTVLEKDSQGRFHDGGGYLVIDVPGTYIIGGFVAGPAGNYECGWTLTYNGSAIDYTAGAGVNYGGVGAVQNFSVNFLTITNFFSSSGYVQLSGFQNSGTIPIAGLWAVYMPA